MSVRAPEVSVIIPTYERRDQTRRAINSVLVQDVDLEIIVVDDASSQAFGYSDDPRVRVVRLERNRGPSAARNRGVYEARGRWIAFLDSDDVWLRGSLGPRLAAAHRGDDREAHTIWTSGFVYASPEGARGEARIPRPSDRPLDFASGCWMCPGSTALMSRSVWDSSGGQDERLRRLEDFEWMLRWGLRGGRLRVFDAISAQITRGRYAQAKSVEVAADYIRSKHSGAPPAFKRRIEAYLQLELAAAYFHKGTFDASLAALAKSWFIRPRLRAALEPFWTKLGGTSNSRKQARSSRVR